MYLEGKSSEFHFLSGPAIENVVSSGPIYMDMRIAFDAKRAYHNNTGLGNYSRTLIRDLAKYYPTNDYFLLNPKKSKSHAFDQRNIHEILPQAFLSKTFSSVWRSKWAVDDLKTLNIDLYHGLSHEIPINIQDTSIKSIVTIHDLIFERFPDQYNPIDVRIYRKKFGYACRYADRIIAISEQTKRDIIDFYKIQEDKIDVCYQSCDNIFNSHVSDARKREVAEKLALPKKFFLSVGSIIERKNLLNICKAMLTVGKVADTPLVVVGQGEGKYRNTVVDFIHQNGLSNKVIFYENADRSDLPAIFSLSEALIYPSFFEGFGIPILEALSAGVPVITSSTSCLPEAGGDAALYADPSQPEEIAECMLRILNDEGHVSEMIRKGYLHAAKFSNENCAAKVMESYRKLIPPDQAVDGIS